MSSRPNGDSGQVAEKVKGKLFNKLPDYKPEYLTEFQFCQFEFFSELGSISSRTPVIFILFSLVFLFQCISILLICPMEYHFYEKTLADEPYSNFYQFLYFILNLSRYSGSMFQTDLYYAGILIVSIIIVSFYFTGIVYTHWRQHNTKLMRRFLAIILMDMQLCYPLIISNVTSLVIISCFAGERHIALSVFYIIMFCCIYSNTNFIYSTLSSSVFFFNGLFIRENNFIRISQLLAAVRIAFNFAHAFDSVYYSSLICGYTMALFGFAILIRTFFSYFYRAPLFIYQGSISFAIVVSGVLTVLRAKTILTSDKLFFVIEFLSIFLSTIILYCFWKLRENRYIKIPKMTSMRTYLLSLQAAFDERADISMIKDGLEMSSSFSFNSILYRYGNLIKPDMPEVASLKSYLYSIKCLPTHDSFFLYDMEKLINLRSTKFDASPLDSRISDFIDLRQAFSNLLSSDMSFNFLFLSSMSSAKDLIRNQVRYLSRTYPNSPSVMSVFHRYYSEVEFNEERAKRWQTEVDGNSYILDFSHLSVLTPFPKGIPKGRCNPNLHLMPKQPQSKLQTNEFFKSRTSFLKPISFIIFDIALITITAVGISFIQFCTSSITESENLRKLTQQIVYTELNISYADINALFALVNGSSTTLANQYIDNMGISIEDTLTVLLNYTDASSQFSSTFNWRMTDIYNDPLEKFNTSLFALLRKYSSTLLSIFTSTNITTMSTIEEGALLSMMADRPKNQLFTQSMYFSSFNTLSSATFSSLKIELTIYIIIVFIALILICIIPLLIYKETSLLISLVPENDEIESKSTISALITHNFRSTAQTFLGFYIPLIWIFVIAIACFFSAYYIFIGIYNSWSNESINIENDMNLIAYSSACVQMALLIKYNQTVTDHTTSQLYSTLEDSIIFLTNGSGYGSSVDFGQSSVVFTNYLLLVTPFLTSTNGTSEAISYLTSYVLPLILSNSEASIKSMNNESEYESACITNIESLAFSSWLILSSVTIYNLFKLLSIADSAKEVLSCISERKVANSDSIHLIIDKTPLSSGIKKSNILDIVPRPCGIAERDGTIIDCNRAWLSAFEMSVDFALGSIIDFSEFNIIDLDSGTVLVTPKETSEERNLRKQNENVREELLNLQTSIIPQRYLGRERFDLGFIVCGVLILSPPINKVDNLEDWVYGMECLTNYINKKLNESTQIERFKLSSRETMLIIESSNRVESVSQMVNLGLDLLKEAKESQWNSKDLLVYCTISCGEGGSLVFSKQGKTDMFGPPFAKQAVLKEQVEPNSVVVCDESASILESSNYPTKFDTCSDNMTKIIRTEIPDEAPSSGWLHSSGKSLTTLSGSV